MTKIDLIFLAVQCSVGAATGTYVLCTLVRYHRRITYWRAQASKLRQWY